MLVWLVQLTVFVPLCSCELFGYEGNTCDDLFRYYMSDTTEEANLMDALEKIFNFFFVDYERVNIDGLLGIVISEGQLNMAVQKLPEKSTLLDRLVNLQNKCYNLIKLLKSKVKISSIAYHKLFDNILNTELWQLDHPFENNTLEYLFPYNWTTLPLQTLIKRVFYDGSPKGKQSEMCITELIDSKHKFNEHEYDCVPSMECFGIMSQLNTSHGYPLTHKLLYIQIARALKCNLNVEVVNRSLKHLCSRILQEFRTIETIPHKNVLLQDLYLEQMVLCGLEGFAEFLTSKSRKHLLTWQTKYGCYGKDFLPTSKRWRVKREISRMKYGCESHITGLAAAAISINLNYLLTSIHLNSDSIEEDDNFGMYFK